MRTDHPDSEVAVSGIQEDSRRVPQRQDRSVEGDEGGIRKVTTSSILHLINKLFFRKLPGPSASLT